MLAREKDPVITTHFKQELEKMKKTWKIKPSHHDDTPYIIGPFTNWDPVRMRDAIEYCTINDTEKPNFTQDCVFEGLVRKEVAGRDTSEMTDKEKDSIINKEHKYYQENWHRALLKLIRYKNPSVANSEKYSLLTLKADNTQTVYFHIDFVKPGKVSYVVEHRKFHAKKPRKSFFDYFVDEDEK